MQSPVIASDLAEQAAGALGEVGCVKRKAS